MPLFVFRQKLQHNSMVYVENILPWSQLRELLQQIENWRREQEDSSKS